MDRILNPRVLEKHLMAAGLIPDNCRLISVVLQPMHAAIIRYEIYLSSDNLPRYAKALAAAAAEDKRNGKTPKPKR